MSTYKDHYQQVGGRGGDDVACTHSWEDFTRARMDWLYPDRDHDAAQAADVARWNGLGRGKVAA